MSRFLWFTVYKPDIIRKEYCLSFSCKFSPLQYYQILLKSINVRHSNHKNKKGKLFSDAVLMVYTGKLSISMPPLESGFGHTDLDFLRFDLKM